MFNYNNELNRIQKEYLGILQSFDSTIREGFYIKAVSLIDKCSLFWESKRMEIIEILYDLTNSEKCFLLSGSVYLRIDDNVHYEFGAIGDRNIIYDPVIRMRSLFYNNDRIVLDKSKKYFCDAIQDTVRVLTDYSNCFTVIPVDLLIEDDYEENQMLGEKVYWDILSSVLQTDIRSPVTLKDRFQSLQQLESALGDFANRFVFYDLNDDEMTLKDRVDKWLIENNKIIRFSLDNDIDNFIIASKMLVQQALDILLVCLRFSLYPFIRFEVTMNYFLLIAEALPDDELFRKHVEYAMICFWFANYVIPNDIETMDFTEFFSKCKATHLSEQFHNAVFSGETSISSINAKKAISTMTELFRTKL